MKDRPGNAATPRPTSVHGAPRLADAVVEMPATDRYEFGANWRRFLRDVSPEQMVAAERSLHAILGPLGRRSFVDVGCGSGLFSLAALRLRAERVHSFDFDPESVACTEALRASHHDASNWSIDRASILDKRYVDSLGQFDVVYAWGVLHHTGAMWDAIRAVTRLVKPGGTLVRGDLQSVERADQFTPVAEVETSVQQERISGEGDYGGSPNRQVVSSPASSPKEPASRAIAIRTGPWDDPDD